MTKQKGMSLIELMVAMGLGVFLILGVINVFLSNKDSTQVETSLARLQENGRITLDLMVRDIQMAGYIGCTSGDRNLQIVANGVAGWSPVLGGNERAGGGWSPALSTALNTSIGTDARVGSDVLSVRYGRIMGTTALTAQATGANPSIAISSNPECLSINETAIISSCLGAFLFKVTNAPACDGSATTLTAGTAGNSATIFEPPFEVGTTTFLQSQAVDWFVADTGRRRTALNIPVWALYREFNGTREEMIEGVEYMQLLYGERLNTGNMRYVTAGNVTASFANVVSVRVGLLMQSFEPILDAPDSFAYQVLDESIGSTGTTYTHNGDLTLRRVFHTTALMRN